MHGKTSMIYHEGDPLFDGVPSPFEATRYHSLIVEPESLPDSLMVIALTEEGEIMGLRHREYPVLRRAVPPGEYSDRLWAAHLAEFPEDAEPVARLRARSHKELEA